MRELYALSLSHDDMNKCVDDLKTRLVELTPHLVEVKLPLVEVTTLLVDMNLCLVDITPLLVDMNLCLVDIDPLLVEVTPCLVEVTPLLVEFIMTCLYQPEACLIHTVTVLSDTEFNHNQRYNEY